MAKSFNFNAEMYFCSACSKEFNYLDSFNNKWKCLICDRNISVKISINGHSYNVIIQHPEELKQMFSITLDLRNIHKILKIEKVEYHYKVALEKYTEVTLYKDDEIATIVGSWPKSWEKIYILKNGVTNV